MTASVNGELPDLFYRVNLFDLSLRHFTGYPEVDFHAVMQNRLDKIHD